MDRPIGNRTVDGKSGHEWKKPGQQWKVGSELDPPVLPTYKSALEFPPGMMTWDQTSPIQGVNVLALYDFDLNILKPKVPENSPHWKSPSTATDHTYCTAWHLRIRNKVYELRAFIPESEALIPTVSGEPKYNGFFEGAATLSDENGLAGHGFVEQMGYN